MNVTVNYHVRSNRIPAIMAKMPGAVSAVVRKTAYDILDTAQDIVPVDTGYLGGSITPTVEEYSATIQPAAEYAAYVEFGTYKMRAQPYMRPAADMHEPRYAAAMEDLFRSL